MALAPERCVRLGFGAVVGGCDQACYLAQNLMGSAAAQGQTAPANAPNLARAGFRRSFVELPET